MRTANGGEPAAASLRIRGADGRTVSNQLAQLPRPLLDSPLGLRRGGGRGQAGRARWAGLGAQVVAGVAGAGPAPTSVRAWRVRGLGCGRVSGALRPGVHTTDLCGRASGSERSY